MSVATSEGDIQYERSNLSRHHTDPNQCELFAHPSIFWILVEDHGRRARGPQLWVYTGLAAEVSLPPKTKPNQTRRNTLLKKTGVTSNGGVLASATLRSIQHGVEGPMGSQPVRRVIDRDESSCCQSSSCLHAMKRNHQPCEPSKFPSPLPVSGSERC